MLWKLRDDLKSNCSVGFLKELLMENNMNSKGGENDVCTIFINFLCSLKPCVLTFSTIPAWKGLKEMCS